ncbi:MAG: sterol desaturase family protein [Bdellovibrionaceae bacterium]|nr:sterol desaturase family protein [Bdellovibrionales bacterium]MCB9255151.1 sterol desaturase family protein [Pseudobdellovibrionaceae bacterium]
MQPLDLNPTWATAPVFFFIVISRYALLSGALYFFFYRWRREALASTKIEARWPKPEVVRREILWSISTSAIMAVAGTAGLWAWAHGYTRVYLDIDEYGWGYFFLSVPILMCLHEVYFYWTHRWLHLPWWFRKVHRIHHESVNPTPWAVFSFHPVEAGIQAVVLPVLVLFVPVHPAALLIFLTIMTVTGVLNHTGYEIYPKKLATSRMGRYVIGATHHYLHHRKFHCNFGLYVSVLDHWFGTEDPQYVATYQKVIARRLRLFGLRSVGRAGAV